MAESEHLFICGASARAAAFSALRAGLHPWCADLFADRDLQARCSAAAVPVKGYPRNLIGVSRLGPAGPWMYTGGLENHPRIIAAISRGRPLWGSGPDALAAVRDPVHLARLAALAGVPAPESRRNNLTVPADGSWLVKPRKSAGGGGIAPWRGTRRPGPLMYFQEFVDGSPCSAAYLGEDGRAQFLGATRQLVGESWLAAPGFAYCGSIGPLKLSARLQDKLERLGEVLAAEAGLRGLFGVDFVLRDKVPWIIEVNPRYTASMEVLEVAQGVPFLGLHRRVFVKEDPPRRVVPLAKARFMGKGIIFARRAIDFPETGPWDAGDGDPPAFADIPIPGARIEKGRPVLTILVRRESPAACLEELQAMARRIDRHIRGE